jgi:hypothetical protein
MLIPGNSLIKFTVGIEESTLSALLMYKTYKKTKNDYVVRHKLDDGNGNPPCTSR